LARSDIWRAAGRVHVVCLCERGRQLTLHLLLYLFELLKLIVQIFKRNDFFLQFLKLIRWRWRFRFDDIVV
jgi:hypothetical protein